MFGVLGIYDFAIEPNKCQKFDTTNIQNAFEEIFGDGRVEKISEIRNVYAGCGQRSRRINDAF